MTPNRIWLALCLLALSTIAFLDAAGTVDFNRAFEEWWPMAIVAFGAVHLAAARRIAPGAVVIVALGVALLASEQEWAGRAVVWAALFLGFGIAVLAGLRVSWARRCCAAGRHTREAEQPAA